MFVTCCHKPVADAKVYTVGGDTIDTVEFIRLLDEVRWGERVCGVRCECVEQRTVAVTILLLP